MATKGYQNIITDGLIFSTDAYNPKSFVDGNTFAYDLTSNGNNGELINGVDFENNAWTFDGINDYIDYGNSDLFSFGDSSNDSPFTFNFWVNMTDVTRFRMIGKEAGSGTDEYYLNTTGSDRLFFVIFDGGGGNYRYIQSVDTMTQYEGQWINITGSYNGQGGSNSNDGLTLYVNAAEVSITQGGLGTYIAMHNTTLPVFSGRLRQDNSYSNGKMSIFKIYNRELTAEEVLQNYNANKWRFL